MWECRPSDRVLTAISSRVGPRLSRATEQSSRVQTFHFQRGWPLGSGSSEITSSMANSRPASNTAAEPAA